LAEIRRARELDPLSPSFALEHATILWLARRFDAAEREYRRILAQGQDTGAIRTLLAITLIGQGRTREAAAEFEAAAAKDGPLGSRDALVAGTWALLGDRAPAEALLAQIDRDAGKRYVPAMSLAYLHGALNWTEELFSDLEQACRNREHFLVFAKVNFMFDPVREHPRFQTILRELHLA